MASPQQPQGPLHRELAHRVGEAPILDKLAELDPKPGPVPGSQASLNPLLPAGESMALRRISDDCHELHQGRE